MTTTMDQLFLEINKYKLTTSTPVNPPTKSLKVHNELPLISQSIANAIATVGWALSSPRGQQNIQKTIERSVNRKFLPYVNAVARGNSKSMMHLYEWGQVGVTSGRLFDLSIPAASRGKANFSMKVEFRPSKKLVPLTEAQATPGPSGKVVKKQHIFFNKAMVMEYGMTVVIRPKNTKYMAFDNPPGALQTKSGLTFSSRPVVVNYAMRPSAGALNTTIKTFFSGYGAQEVSRGLKDYSRTVKRGAEKSSHLISVSMPSDAYAHSVASKISNAMMPGG
jgi:hypothetical protein